LIVGRDSVQLSDQSEIPEKYHQLLEYAGLSSQQDPFDPLEKSILEANRKFLTDPGHTHSDWTMVREYPLSSHLLSLSRVWQSPNSRKMEIAAKGAPEAIADLCHLTNPNWLILIAPSQNLPIGDCV
jgi:P-type Ca2+ transporter type 2C